jgi:protease secretion system outer membrane protein
MIMNSILKNARVAVCIAVFALLGTQVHARDLLADYQKALQFDPQYQTALADLAIAQRGAKQAKSVFYPEATFNSERLATDTSTRTSLGVSQPLLDWERYLTYGQAAPKELLGEISLQLKQQDLTNKLIKAAIDLVLANESLRLNETKIRSVQQQAQRAARMLQLGQGTVTDLRDIQVKQSQARGQQLAFESQLQVAVKQYAAITGETPRLQDFVLPPVQGDYDVLPLATYTDIALRANPSVLAGQLNVDLARTEVQKIKASLVPTVQARYSYNWVGDNTTTQSYIGMSLSVPLRASTVYSMQSAEANVVKTQEALRETESSIRLSADKLRGLVINGVQALKIQREAIEAAEFSVEANTKSYQGGVRTAVDVLNAIQTVFQVKSEYVTLATTQAQNILALLLLGAMAPLDSVEVTQQYLFGTP